MSYLGLIDLVDGGGAGRAGDRFEDGGLLSDIGNMLFRPYGYRDRREELGRVQPQPRPMPPAAPQPYAEPSPAAVASYAQGGQGGAPMSPVTATSGLPTVMGQTPLVDARMHDALVPGPLGRKAYESPMDREIQQYLIMRGLL